MNVTLNPYENAKRTTKGGNIPQHIEEDIERALLGNHVYSTIERECGDWIDGKTMYEVVSHYEGAWNSRVGRDLVDNVDTLIKCEIRLTNTDSDSASFGVQRVSGCVSSLDEVFQVVAKNNKITAYSLNTWANLSVDFILTYTKVN